MVTISSRNGVTLPAHAVQNGARNPMARHNRIARDLAEHERGTARREARNRKREFRAVFCAF